MGKYDEESFEGVHWADNSALRTIETFPEEEVYTVASGITPSGIVHVGHFREIITSELVRRALEDRGFKTRFIYSWDSYDAFRKVPKNIPSEWEKYLRLPDASVPDPNGVAESFAEYYMQEAEREIAIFNFPIEFQRQHILQTSGIYAEGIARNLRMREKIRPILDKYRQEALGSDWFPLELYCEKCGKDETEIFDYDENYTLSYKCLLCSHSDRIDFRKKAMVKLPWRLDWPMRWAHFSVAFEPGGKDHSTPGGSYDTGKEIVEIVSNRKAPVYTFYNFIGMKGVGGKISSSKGDGATIADVLKIYTPELVLFLFAGTRPNAEMSLSFDLDVIKIYEDFDKLERLYYGLEVEENPKKMATLRRTYELIFRKDSILKEIPLQPGFRHLATLAQANSFDFERVSQFFTSSIRNDFDMKRLRERFEAVSNWLRLYAPPEMIFSINEKPEPEFLKRLSKDEFEVLRRLGSLLEGAEDIDSFSEGIRDLIKEFNFGTSEFFKLTYLFLISKEKGPRLAGFMFENKNKILSLFREL